MKQYQIICKYKKLPDFIFNHIKKDKKWFYSLYNDEKGRYILLRLSHSYIHLNNELKKRKIKYTIFPYDNFFECQMTMKYFDEFVDLFHAESMLIQKTKKEDITKVLERIIHLAHNMAGFDYWQESINLSSQSITRAWVAGSESKKIKEKK